MRYKVPQNIDMEDRIVGPLTLMQFVYLFVGFGIIYVLYQTIFFTQPIIFYVIAIPTGLMALALAFLKVQEIPFPKFLLYTALFLIKPKRRIWLKFHGKGETVIKKMPTTPEQRSIPHTKLSKKDLIDLSKQLDTTGLNN